MENTFWGSRLGDGKFVESFKKSFTLYVESGMMVKVEKDIDMFRNEHGEISMTKDFKARFYRFIVNHYICKFHCFYLHLDKSKYHFLHLYTAIPEESHAHVGEELASGESAKGEPKTSTSGDQVINKKKFTWLRNLMPKFHRRQRV